MNKRDLFREQRRLQKRLDRAAAHLIEDRRLILVDIINSENATSNMKLRAELLLRKLEKRRDNKLERDKQLDKLIADFDNKHASAPVPTQSEPVSTRPVSAQPESAQPVTEPVLKEEEAEIRLAKIFAAATERQIEEMRRDNERYHHSTARECLVNEDAEPRSLIPRRRVPSDMAGPSCGDLYTGAPNTWSYYDDLHKKYSRG